MVDTFVTHYLYRKRGIFYFSRHVPLDVRAHYGCDGIVRSLRTKSHSRAVKTAIVWSEYLEQAWANIRLQHLGVLSLSPVVHQSHGSVGPTISEALETYLQLKGSGKGELFFTANRRAVSYLIDILGDLPVDQYTSTDAARFRDALFARNLSSSSVKRIFSVIRALVQLTLTEHGIQTPNPVKNTYLPSRNDVRERPPIPIEDIHRIQAECRQTDDDLRWLIALVSDTGMRLAEAVGLAIDDIKLDHEYPHLILQQHPWRPLKTATSERLVPLVGASLWAAHRIVDTQTGPCAFPRYTTEARANANHASAALNKWLKNHAPEGCVIHSFRHSMRDRLRAVQCPFDIVNQIGGWSTAGVGNAYGIGYGSDVLHGWMKKAVG